MVCLVCRQWAPSAVCRQCGSGFVAAPPRFVERRRVFASYDHAGPARVLVHRLKYEGFEAAALPLVNPLGRQLAGLVDGVVGVPRVRLRRWRYGVDPGRVLGVALAHLIGVPYFAAISAGWWSPRQAGLSVGDRSAPRFSTASSDNSVLRNRRLVVIDDVVTTGATLLNAAACLEQETGSEALLVAATSADKVTSLSLRTQNGVQRAGTATQSSRRNR